MFTIDQINEAGSKIRSGADFPGYVQDLIRLGVIGYESYVSDGHATYWDMSGYKISRNKGYPEIKIADQSDKTLFQKDLKEHQQGNTNYSTFCADCARTGVERWVVDTIKLTCSYFDKSGEEILVESIPVPQ